MKRNPQGRSEGRRARRRGALAAALAALALGAAPALAAGAEAPTVLSTDDATNITYTTADVAGVVQRAADPSPESDAACKFEYVLDAQFRGSGFKNSVKVPCDTDPVSVPGPTPVGAELSGLKPGAEYHLRLSASNLAGSSSLAAANTFTTTAVTPPSATISAPTAITATSAHFAGTVNPQLAAGPAGLYEVKWHFQCTPQCLGADGKALSGPPIGADNSSHPVSADALLEPNTLYRVSLIAENAGESAAAGPLAFTTDILAPLARTLDADVGVEGAQLGAKINPRNSAVTYQFEWGPTATYGNLAPATPEPFGLADNAFHVVAEQITGLAPLGTYHYRVVATNIQTGEKSFGVDRAFSTRAAPEPPPPCPNAASQVGASVNLPDCRAWEFITPGLNNAAPAAGWPGIAVQGVRADGGALAFIAGAAPTSAEGAAATNVLVATRDAGGWATRSLAAPTPLASGTYFGANRSTVGLSADLSQSVLWSNQPLAGGSSPPGTNLYLRRADGSFVALTKVGAPTFAPGGELVGASEDFKHLFVVSTEKQLGEDPIAAGNLYEWVGGTLRLVAVLPGGALAPEGATLPIAALPSVSADGNEVLFKAKGLAGLYLRSGGTETVEVSATQRSVEPDPNPPAEAIAAGISADGGVVLFTSASELTNDAYTGRSGGIANDKGRDLYSYDVASKVLTDLTVAADPADALAGADVEAVLGASQDASYVYFVARGNLAAGASSGERNLYVAHAGKTEFIGTDPSSEPAQFYLTPDGRHAAFTATEPQTGYDSAGLAQVYRYSYGVGLECASCRPSGEPPAAGAQIAGRALSDDGERLFFQSSDRIVTEAQSGQSNVFSYSDGEVHLLTPGDGAAALLLGTSADGADVFVASFEELSSQGQGKVFGIYDARIGANVAPPSETAGCQGENCREGVAAPGESPSAGSAGFEAPGKVSIAGPEVIAAAKVKARVIVPGAGELTISGRGLKALSQRVSKAGTVALTLALTPGAEKRRRNKGAFKTEVEVLFKSTSGDISRDGAQLTFKAARRPGAGK